MLKHLMLTSLLIGSTTAVLADSHEAPEGPPPPTRPILPWDPQPIGPPTMPGPPSIGPGTPIPQPPPMPPRPRPPWGG